MLVGLLRCCSPIQRACHDNELPILALRHQSQTERTFLRFRIVRLEFLVRFASRRRTHERRKFPLFFTEIKRMLSGCSVSTSKITTAPGSCTGTKNVSLTRNVSPA